MAAAQTETGKTAGFTLILTPTRELAAQVAERVTTYGKHVKLCPHVIFGGVPAGSQIKRLRHGADIVIATPGRLLDLINQGVMKFDRLEVLILDEADRMLDMGFIHDIKKTQTLVFSRTKHGANKLASFSDSQGISSVAIHKFVKGV